MFRFTSRSLLLILTLALLGASENSLYGQLTEYTDRATFEAAAGTTVIEDFNSFVTEEAFHTNAVDAGDFTISPDAPISDFHNFIDIPAHQDSFADVDGTTSMNVRLNKSRKLVFTFDTAITAFGGDFKALNDGQSRVEFLINGNSVEPDIQNDTSQAYFYGIISDQAFTVLEIHAKYASDGFGADNITYSASAVPEPRSIVLLSIAAGSFGVFYYRRKKHEKAAEPESA